MKILLTLLVTAALIQADFADARSSSSSSRSSSSYRSSSSGSSYSSSSQRKSVYKSKSSSSSIDWDDLWEDEDDEFECEPDKKNPKKLKCEID